jgi:phospholipid/cholesterol/gamma-HCH transport system substrate-binding protein
MRRSLALAATVALAAGLVLSACGGSKDITVSAKFSDIGDLAPGAPVLMSDIQVGKVTGIKLAGYQALVTMKIDPKAAVPQDVTARIRRTSLLGERVVDFLLPTTVPQNAPLLADGDVIRHTVTRPDLEDLVRAGTDVLQPITASEVATLVDEGAKGFAGHGADLRTVLDNLGQITHAYAGETDTIDSLITSLNQLNGTLAAHADAQGLSIKNTQRALDELDQEGAQLEAAIKSLARLAGGARGILDAHVDEMSRSFSQLRVILGILQDQENDLTGFLADAPFHNRNTQMVEYLEFNQVLQDFVICGANEDKSDPARTCTPNGQS